MIAPSTFTPPPPVEESVEWLRRPQDEEAHAFATTNGPGWMWSRCKRARLTAGLKDAGDLPRCGDCRDLVEGPESEKRLMDGNR